jgi:hypothetical protein
MKFAHPRPPLSLLTLILLFTLLFAPLSSARAHPDPSASAQDVVWVLVKTEVNPDQAETHFVGGQGTGDWYPEERYKGSELIYSPQETVMTVYERRVDGGPPPLTDLSYTVSFERPPQTLQPGETIELRGTFSGGGEINEIVGPTARFWYTIDKGEASPGHPLTFAPWKDSEESSGQEKTFSYQITIPKSSYLEEFTITAQVWNASPCKVYWTYQKQEAGVENADNTGPGAIDPGSSDGINPLIPVIGIGVVGAVGAAAAAGAAAVAVSRGKKGKKKKKDPRKKNPCVDDLNRLKEASAQARALHDGIQTLRSYLELLDTQYENIRQAAYWNASIDLGFLGASIFGGGVQQTIVEAMRESAAKALGSQLMKNVTNDMLDQGVSWDSLVKAPYGGAKDEVMKTAISDTLLQEYQSRLAQRGISGTVRKAAIKGYSTAVVGPLSSGLMNLVSFGKIAYGAYTEAQKLEAIREMMSKVRKSLFEMELLYEDALSEMRISRSVYNKCRKMWQS